jgi:hypothetical protein
MVAKLLWYSKKITTINQESERGARKVDFFVYGSFGTKNKSRGVLECQLLTAS